MFSIQKTTPIRTIEDYFVLIDWESGKKEKAPFKNDKGPLVTDLKTTGLETW